MQLLSSFLRTISTKDPKIWSQAIWQPRTNALLTVPAFPSPSLFSPFFFLLLVHSSRSSNWTPTTCHTRSKLSRILSLNNHKNLHVPGCWIDEVEKTFSRATMTLFIIFFFSPKMIELLMTKEKPRNSPNFQGRPVGNSSLRPKTL